MTGTSRQLRSRRRAFGSVMALVLACLWIGGPLHAHESMVPGWHDATPHGCPHKSDQGPCSLCRLAREISVTALTVQRLTTPELAADMLVATLAPAPAVLSRGADAARAPPLQILPHLAD